MDRPTPKPPEKTGGAGTENQPTTTLPRTGGDPPLINYPVVYPQQFAMNRAYTLPTTIIPTPSTSSTSFGLTMPSSPTYSYAPMPGFGYNMATMPTTMPVLTPQAQQEMAMREQFFKQLQATAQQPQGKVTPAAQQRSRDYTLDTYFYDEWRSRSQNPSTPQRQQRGPGIYSPDELRLIPLQRPNSDPTKPDGTPNATTISTSTAPASATVVLSATPDGTGSQTAMQFRFQDVPRVRLGVDQDHYLAGIAMAYSLLSGLLKMEPALEDACRAFDVDEDTIAVTESQLETLLYNMTEADPTATNKVRPLLFTFPLHDRYMSIALRVYIYGDIITDPRTGFKRALTSLSPWSWRHALPVGDNRFRLRGEQISVTSEEFLLREKYHQFLVRLYSMMWRSLMRLRVEQTALFTPDYSRFVETTLAALRPAAQSVAVLEARIRAIVARLQLLHGVMFNTAQFYTGADTLKNIMHPIILQIIGRYLYFRLT